MFSASSETRDRNAPTNANQIRLQTSRIGQEHRPIRYQLPARLSFRQGQVLRRKLKSRARLTNNDRWFFVQLYRCFPSILPALMIIRPDTLVRWHRAGFRRYWRWRSRSPGGRPPIEAELRALIRP